MLPWNDGSCYKILKSYFVMEPRAARKNRMGDRWQRLRYKKMYKIIILYTANASTRNIANFA